MKSSSRHKVAVIIGIGAYNDLGVVRSCGEAGMKVVLLAPGSMIVPIYRSRHVDLWLDTNTCSEKDLFCALEIVSERYKGKELVLFPTGDSQAVVINRNKVSLSKKFKVPGIGGDMEKVMDKLEMSRIAKNSGMKVPHTELHHTSQVSASQLSYPCIIKPAASILGVKSDIAICRTVEQGADALNLFRSHSTESIIVQDFIDGEGQYEIAVPGVSLANGNVIIGGYLRKHRTFGNGSTVYATFIPEIDTALSESVKRYISGVGYKGIFDIELLVNKDGVFFIECNYRNGAYGYVATKAGLNLPALFAGISASPSKRLKKLTMMEERADILNALSGQVSKLSWFWQMMSADVHLWWSWRDPMPTLSHYLRKLGFKM